MNRTSRLVIALALAGVLSVGWHGAAQAQVVDSLQIAVPSLNMPADQQLELAKAIYQQLVGQNVTPATLVLVDETGAQVSFDASTLSQP